jgi:hypothetical protein
MSGPNGPSAAPQIRTVPKFSPDMSANAGFNASAGASAASARNLTGNSSPDSPQDPFQDPVNPFSTSTTPVSEQSAAIYGTAAAAGAAGMVAGAAIGSERDRRRSPTGEPPGPSPPSPAGSADAVSISSGMMGPGGGPSNVYRVQMDFNPSMEDELGLRAGTLARMLHEYDDGWVSFVFSKSLHAFTCPNYLLGSLHPSRSVSARCGPTELPVGTPCEASPARTSWRWSWWSWSSRSPANGPRWPDVTRTRWPWPSVRTLLPPGRPSTVPCRPWLRSAASASLPW